MPVNVPSYANQQLRLVVEDSYGTTPSGGSWRKLNNMRIDLEPTFETEQFSASGDAVPTISALNDDYTQGDGEGKACYNATIYPIASLFGRPTITTPGGGSTSRLHSFSWDGRTPFVPASYTIDAGVTGNAERAPGCLFNGFQISGSREGMDFSTSILGQKMLQAQTMGGVTSEVQSVAITGTPTGGTFTLTFAGYTTAAIQYNASAAAVQAALEALPNIGTDNVTCTGGPLPGTAVAVTFKGYLAGADVAQMTATASLTGGTTPAVTVSTTTPGADSVTDITAVPMFPLQFSLFMDSSWATLGTTRLTQTYEMDLGFGEKWERTRPINALLNSDGYVEMADQEHTLSLNMAVDKTQRGLIDSLRAGDMKFIRILAEGNTIESTIKYAFQMDLACFIREAAPAQEYNNIYAREFTLILGRDATSGNCAKVEVTNTLTAL